MRDPKNLRCPGPEAIRAAVITAWLDEFDLPAWCESAARRHGPSFMSTHDTDVGRVLLSGDDEPWARFRDWLRANPAVLRVLRASGTSLTPPDPHDPVVEAVARRNFNETVAVDVGRHAKATAWWRESLPEIKRNQRRTKEVRRVLES